MTRPYAPGYRIPTDLLLKAYASGVFPMAESAGDPEVFWVRPEMRGVIPLDGFHVPKSLKKAIRHGRFGHRKNADGIGLEQHLRRNLENDVVATGHCEP